MNDFSEQVNDILQAAIEQPDAVKTTDRPDDDSQPLKLADGEQIGSYKIIRQLGAGGMGEVYLAEDAKLKRSVALKFFSAQTAANSQQLARFILEAQTVSALNHPNILTVYEIGVERGVHFIVTEYIDGDTLRESLEDENLSCDKRLSIAVQTAEALTTAHEAGIVHRDIKPENIMVRRDGYVKVLDFGLAKLTEASASDTDPEAQTKKLVKTNPGLIMGTVRYMSPEQTRGRADVDARTDIWSLGVILFEMFAGRVPFEGNTFSDIIASILTAETPPLAQFMDECPPELERIVTKATRKDRDERYQSMKDLALDLKSLRKELEILVKSERAAVKTPENATAVISQRPTAALEKVRRFSTGGVFLILLCAGLISAGFWWFSNRKTIEPATINETSTLKNSEIVSWSSSPGEVYSIGSFSPDAKMIAFTSTKAGTRNIWIKQTGDGDAIQITKDEFKNEKPIWSPNAEELAFFSSRGNQAGIWRIPILGGAPKLVTEISDASVSLRRWSEKNLIYYESNHNLYAVDLDAGKTRQITDFAPKKINAESISISPDEQRIAYITGDDDQWRVWTANADGAAAKQIAASNSEIKNTVWHSDGKRVFYSALVDGTFQIFVADAEGGAPRQITSADKDSLVLDASSDGTKILYGSAKEESDVWAVNSAGSKEYAVASDINSELWADASPDGKTLVYQSIKNLSQGDKLFNGAILAKQTNSDEQPVQLVASGFLPEFSPDGQKIAFLQVTGKKYQIGTIKATGGGQKLLATNEVAAIGNTVLPYNRIQTSDFSWSPDSSKIAYVSEQNGLRNIRLANADGAGDEQLTDNKDENLVLNCPLWSSDGKRVAYSSKTDKRNASGDIIYGVSVIDTETKTAKIIIQKNFFLRLIGWSERDKEIVLASIAARTAMTGLQPEISLSAIDVESGAARSIGTLKNSYLYNIRLSPDKKTTAFASNQEGRDNIWTMSAAGGEAKKITGNNDARIYFSNLSWSPDGSTIFFGKQSRYSLLSMLANFK